jgi:putative effector of murein hydrolase
VNKEEILVRSRADNGHGDERQKMIDLKSSSAGSTATIGVFIIFIILHNLTNVEFINDPVVLLALSGMAVEYFVKYRYAKNVDKKWKKIYLAATVVCSVTIIMLLIVMFGVLTIIFGGY